VVRDLTTDVTETGNVYVVAPVPPSVQKAMTVTAKLPVRVREAGAGGQHDGADAANGRASGSDRELGVERLDWQLRQPAMRSDAGETLQQSHQSDRGLRALLPSRFGS
jgi:hypothetical protein